MRYPITLFKEGGVKLSVMDSKHYTVEDKDGPITIHTTLLEALEQVSETLTRLGLESGIPFDEIILIMDQNTERMYGRLLEILSQGVLNRVQMDDLERSCVRKLEVKE